MTPIHHAYYFDFSPDHRLSTDPEGNLVWLCDDCAYENQEVVEFASEERYNYGVCEVCDDSSSDDPRTGDDS